MFTILLITIAMLLRIYLKLICIVIIMFNILCNFMKILSIKESLKSRIIIMTRIGLHILRISFISITITMTTSGISQILSIIGLYK